MKIMLIDAIDYWMLGDNKNLGEVEQVLPPVGLLYLASYIEKEIPKICSFKILSCVVDCRNQKEMQAHLDEFQPDVVGIRGMNIYAKRFHEIASYAKEWNAKTIVVGGGPYITSSGKVIMEDRNVDYLIYGEGEVAFCEFIKNLVNETDVKNTKSLIFREKDGLTKNPPMQNIANLDELPFPDYRLIDYDNYSKFLSFGFNRRKPGIMFSSRGCPFHCVYCHVEFGKKFRQRSAQNIFDEVRNLYDNFGVKDFYFVDDIFNLNYRRAMNFFDMVIDSDMKINMYFPSGLRGDMLDEKYIDKMVEAGTIYVAYALETSSQRLQKLIKKHLNVEKLTKNIHYTCSKGIIVNVFTLYGLPTQTVEECYETIEHLKQFKSISIPYFFSVKNYPGTEVRDMALTHGHNVESLKAAYSDPLHNVHNSETPTIPKDDFRAIYFTFMMEIFMDEERLSNSIKILRKHFAEEEILDMYSTFFRKKVKNIEKDILAYAYQPESGNENEQNFIKQEFKSEDIFKPLA